MVSDINRLHIELDYGEVVNFNNRYLTISATEENFKKHNKLLIGSYIVLPVYLLKYLGEDLNTAEEFLKFPLIKKPKKMNDLLMNKNISKFIHIQKSSKLDSSEKKIISIFKKLNILPLPIFLKRKPYQLKFSFDLKKILTISSI